MRWSTYIRINRRMREDAMSELKGQQEAAQERARSAMIRRAMEFANEFAAGFRDSEINEKYSPPEVALGLLTVAGQLCGSSVAFAHVIARKSLPTALDLDQMRGRFDETLRVNYDYGAGEVAKRVLANAALPANDSEVN